MEFYTLGAFKKTKIYDAVVYSIEEVNRQKKGGACEI
jgi:hypothetical protein